MARGEYCARHDQYFGNIIPCKYCEEERKDAQLRERLRLVSYDEWKQRYADQSSEKQP